MKPACWIAPIICLSLTLGCGRHTALSASTDADPQKLPFDHPPQTAGISPSRSFVPSVTRLPEGTPLTVSLQHSLSSASAHSNDTFTALLDDPVVIDGQTIVPRGTLVTGRVLDAKHAGRTHDPGYLRIALETLSLDGKQLPLETSSLFAKGGTREDRISAASPDSAGARSSTSREIVFVPGRRLSFRLAQNLDLP